MRIPNVYVLVLILAAGLSFADTLPLVIRAQTDFDRVVLPPQPQIAAAGACVQSEAALLPVARPEEVSQVHYRKGYCLMVEGVLTGSKADLLEASREFQTALTPVVQRTTAAAPPAPESSGLRALAAIAKLRAAPDPKELPGLEHDLMAATTAPVCPATAMSQGACQSAVATGKVWLAWIADQQDRQQDAARILAAFPESGWHSWIAGKQAMAGHRYPEAVEHFQDALRRWPGRLGLLDTITLMTPQPDIQQAEHALGAARYLAGDYQGSIQSLDTAVHDRREDAGAIFLRGLARQKLGSMKAALEDYNLASRVALAHTGEPSTAGDAHYYRGIWLFRQGDAEHAEGEFSAALNSGVDASLRPDVTAWWRTAAVARGECGASARFLSDSLNEVSGFFPKREAQGMLDKCQKISALRP